MLLQPRTFSFYLLVVLNRLGRSRADATANSTCEAIAKAVSPQSDVYYPGKAYIMGMSANHILLGIRDISIHRRHQALGGVQHARGGMLC